VDLGLGDAAEFVRDVIAPIAWRSRFGEWFERTAARAASGSRLT
jgi:hypothetical protein